MKNYSELGTLLTREEAKKIRGGATGQTCSYDGECPPGLTCLNGVCSNYENFCGSKSASTGRVECYLTPSDAESYATRYGGWWCCASCSTTDWYTSNCS